MDSVAGDDLKKDYFGLYDVTSPGHMAYNWRRVFYHPATRMIYGVHGNSGKLDAVRGREAAASVRRGVDLERLELPWPEHPPQR